MACGSGRSTVNCPNLSRIAAMAAIEQAESGKHEVDDDADV